jgi:hypothetical protein
MAHFMQRYGKKGRTVFFPAAGQNQNRGQYNE